MLSSFSMFNVFTMSPKNELKVSAIFASSAKTLPPSTSAVLLFLDPFFSVKSEDTVFQNNLLSVLLLRFTFQGIVAFFVVITLHNSYAAQHMQAYFLQF